MKGDGSFDAVREVIEAFNIVMTLTGEFFKVPAVVAEEEKAENQPDEKAPEEAKN